MARKGRDFELDYEWLYKLDKDLYKVSSPGFVIDKTTGESREIDILIEFFDGDGILRRISVECRDWKKTQNVMWIEQLQQKKEDCELDYIIATTTTTFSAGAIAKAKYHGVIVEKVERFNSTIIPNTNKEFFADLFFMKFQVEQLNFLINYKVVPFCEFAKSLSIGDYNKLMVELNYGLYLYLDPHFVEKIENFDESNFYNNEENNYLTFKGDYYGIKSKLTDLFEKYNIYGISYEVKGIPFRVSLPLNRSLSVFEVEKKKNKKYKAIFGDENDECLIVGYLDDNKIFNELKLKNRKYYRFVGMSLNINTIFPSADVDVDQSMSEIVNKAIGKLDFSKIM